MDDTRVWNIIITHDTIMGVNNHYNIVYRATLIYRYYNIIADHGTRDEMLQRDYIFNLFLSEKSRLSRDGSEIRLVGMIILLWRLNMNCFHRVIETLVELKSYRAEKL